MTLTLSLVFAALLLAVVTYVALGAVRLRASSERSAEEIFAARRAELAEEAAGGALDAQALGTLETELARGAVQEARLADTTDVRPHQRTAALVALIAVLGAVSLPVYLHLGNPELADAEHQSQRDHPSLEQMEAELGKRIAATPNDPEPRLWLARVYVSTKRYGQAVDQFEQILPLTGDNAAVLVQYADALAMLNGGRLAGKPAELIQRALKAEPAQATALWLAGLAAEEAGDKAKAIDYLQQARKASVAAELPVEELDAQIAALGGEVPKAASGPRIAVKVAVDPALLSKITPDATLFVLAKRPAGMPMPLAVKRLPAKGFPLEVVLDDSLAMAPTAKLSSAEQVDVTARISQQGQPVAASGDLQGVQRAVAVGPDVHLEITINEIVP